MGKLRMLALWSVLALGLVGLARSQCGVCATSSLVCPKSVTVTFCATFSFDCLADCDEFTVNVESTDGSIFDVMIFEGSEPTCDLSSVEANNVEW
ncbi:MAG: hypothetical protein IPK82_23195 [Polyangiaceae bacterium]|nr:hypothetical protein [Polyangiaceae bacterium]